MKPNQDAKRAQFWQRARLLFARSWQLQNKKLDKRVIRILRWFAKRAGFTGFEKVNFASLVEGVSKHRQVVDDAVELLREELLPPGPQKVTKPKGLKSSAAVLFLCAALSQTPYPQPVSLSQGWMFSSSPAYFMLYFYYHGSPKNSQLLHHCPYRPREVNTC